MTAPIVKVNDSELQVTLGKLSKVWTQAASVALNRTRDDAIAPQITKIRSAFTIRAGKDRFLVPPKSAPAAFKATETRLFVPISLAFDDGKKSVGYHAKRILEKHGATQDVPSSDPFIPFFRPTGALRPVKSALVPMNLYPKKLLGQFNSKGELTGVGRRARVTKQTRRVIRRRGLAAVVEGAGLLPKQYRTGTKIVGSYFILGQPGSAEHGIYQRIGDGKGKSRGSDDIVMIWDFMQSQKVTKRLNFEPETREVIASRWAINFAGAFDLAMAGTLSVTRGSKR
jgi:hypothetical protein